MANVDRPNGFKFAKSLIGAPVQGLLRRYEAADRSADTVGNHGDIYIGDPVKLVSGKVQVADTGDTVLGVVVGVGSNYNVQFGEGGMFNPSNLEQRYLPADTEGYVWVLPARDSLFEVQSDSDLDLVVGDAADMTTAVDTAHGNTITGVSTVEITTSTNSDVTVVEIKESPDNDTAEANARYFVKFNTIQDTYA